MNARRKAINSAINIGFKIKNVKIINALKKNTDAAFLNKSSFII